MKLCVLWYFRYPLSYRNVAEMMAIRGIQTSHQSIYRWVGKLGKEFGEKARNLHGNKRTVSWYVDETYVKVKGQWKYLYRAVDRNGEILDVMLSAHRSKKAVERFFKLAMKRLGVKAERIYTDNMRGFGSFMRTFQITWNWESIYGYLRNLNASSHGEREKFCQKVHWLFGFKNAS